MAKSGVDYSALEQGQRLQAESEGVYYAAEVVTVATGKKRAKAPVKVHFLGYTADYDEWVGADRIRSKALKASATSKTEKPPTKGLKSNTKVKTTSTDKPKAPLEFEMGYWGIRGLGAVLRMIFEYKEAKYTDHIYSEFCDPPDGSKWFAEAKPKILEMNPLANLPYVICGNTCVCQTNAVLGFLGQKFRMAGFGKGKLMNDQLLCEIYDVRNGMIDLAYSFKKVNRTEEEYKENAEMLAGKPPFRKFEAWLDKYETDYFSGPKPNTADFHIWEMLDQHKILAERFEKPSIFEDFPKCKAFYDRFRALPTLQKYFESDAYKYPINNHLMANAYFY